MRLGWLLRFEGESDDNNKSNKDKNEIQGFFASLRMTTGLLIPSFAKTAVVLKVY